MTIRWGVVSCLTWALFCTLPAAAQAVQEEHQYAGVGQWRIITVTDQGRFLYCAADTDNAQVTLRIGTDGRTWQLGVPYYDNGPVSGQWGFDGWEDYAEFRTDGDGWAVMDVNQHVLDSLHQFGNFSIELDRGPQHFSLQGSSAALTETLECARNQGRVTGTYFPNAAPPGRTSAIDWIDGQPHQPIDGRAVAVGVMSDGHPSFVCTGVHNGGLHPGMAGVWIEGCAVGYGGREIRVADYSLMTGSGQWVRGEYGQVPANAVQGGHEADGTPLYVCRAAFEGNVFAGKTRPGLGGCNIPDLGQEVTVPAYEVLTP